MTSTSASKTPCEEDGRAAPVLPGSSCGGAGRGGAPSEARPGRVRTSARSEGRSRRFQFAITRTPGSDVAVAPCDPWQRAAQVSIIGLFGIALTMSLYMTQSVLVPLVLAWVFGTILSPVVAFMESHRVPRSAGVVLVVVALLVVVAGLVMLLTLPLTYWVGRASELGAVIKSKLQLIAEPFAFLSELSKAIADATNGGAAGSIKVEGAPPNIVAGILAFLTPAVSQAILFFGGLVFYLIFQKSIRSESVLVFPSRETRLLALRIINDIEHNVSIYFGTFTMVNVALGTVTAIMAYAVGLPNALLWGVLAMVLNYVPYLGVAVMVAVLFVIGLFTFPHPAQALLAPFCYIVLTTLEGQFITPAIMGRRMTLNPFAVFIAIGFWAWLWGPIGAFLAVPMLMVMTVIVRHVFPDDEPVLPE